LVVVDAVVDPFALSLPSHVPFSAAKGYTVSMAEQVFAGKMDSVIKRPGWMKESDSGEMVQPST
jgi:hypothetical protein